MAAKDDRTMSSSSKPGTAMEAALRGLFSSDVVKVRLYSSDAPETPRVTRETPEDAQARHALYDARRVARWERDRPTRYAAAAYADLDPAAQHRDTVARWWDSGHQNLVLAGSTGAGKTHTAYAVGNAATAAGARVIAMTVADYCAALRPSAVEPTRAAEVLVAAANCDLLILDDLGRESLTDWVREKVHEIVDVRGRNNRRMVITTNISPDTTTDRYGSQVLDRIDEDCVTLVFEGASRRRKTWG